MSINEATKNRHIEDILEGKEVYVVSQQEFDELLGLMNNGSPNDSHGGIVTLSWGNKPILSHNV